VGALVRSAAFTREAVGMDDVHADLEALIAKFRAAALDLDTVKAALL
jgi:hypothetical protein